MGHGQAANSEADQGDGYERKAGNKGQFADPERGHERKVAEQEPRQGRTQDGQANGHEERKLEFFEKAEPECSKGHLQKMRAQVLIKDTE